MSAARSPQASGVPAAPEQRAVRLRAFVLGIILMPVNGLWLAHMEMATSGSLGATAGPFPTTFSLFANVILVLVALNALNALFRARAPRLMLTQAEILVLYVMLAIGACIPSVDFLDVLVPMMGHVTRNASAANGWQDLFGKYIPAWFHVTDAEALTGWYLGNANPFLWHNIRPWLVPAAAWTAFAAALFLVMYCMNVLVRRQWTRDEKLSYPIIQLPIDMTEPDGAFFRQRLMWMGFGVAAAISLVNGLSVFIPNVPYIAIKMTDLSPYFTARPWNAMGWTPISLYPFAIGLGFLLPVDLLFSCWFFYFMWKAERVISSFFGWSDYSQTFPYVNEQCFGAYMGIALIAVYGARRHLAAVVRQAWQGRTTDDDSPISYRAAVLGLLIGTGFLVWFMCAAGLSVAVCVAAFAIYFAIAIACTRMRAELGPPAHDLHNGGPDYILTAAFGARAFTTQELTVLSFFYWFNRAYRSIAMPIQLEAFKMAERKSISTRRMSAAILIATVIGIPVGFAALHFLGYRLGVEAKMAPHLRYFGQEAFGRLDNWIRSPRDTDVAAMTAAFLGLAATLMLNLLRMRFSGWVLHPLGLAVSGSYTMNTIWLPMIVAWACKVTILRFGGMRSYRAALPFFMGLLLGDYVVGCLWPIVGQIVGSNAYSFQQ